jgi:glucose/arabinose dehydrogenase
MPSTALARAGLLTSAFLGMISTSQAFGLTNSIAQGSLTIKLTTAATINTGTDGTPQGLTAAPGDPNRIFIATRNGDIRILSGGTLSSTPFLNMAADGISVYTGGEGGLLGLAFSPNYATNGKFYTIDTEPFSTTGPAADFSSPELFPTTTTNPNNQILVREWTVSANPAVANATSRVLLRINHPEDNHQGGSLRFGPDGDLYIGLGDGGGGNDFNGSATSTTDGHNNTIGNGQDTTVPFGKILRINPDATARAGFSVSTNGQYSIPTDNPFASTGGGNLKEIFAYGLRNPYKFTFDTANNALIAGDVGQSAREEVDTIVNGGNYGWPFREGTRDNSADAGRTTPTGFTSTLPIAEYTHGDGEAIIGGVVDRNAGDFYLNGQYIFGDLGGTNGATGRMFYTDASGGTVSEFKYDPSGITPSTNLYGFGTGPDGSEYALFSSGAILKISAIPEPTTVSLLALAGLAFLRRPRRT